MPHHLSTFSSQFSPPAARHYHPTLSIWLSVDPMSDKYPSMSPYTYCANNPVRLVDPDGNQWGDGSEEIANQMISAAQCQIERNNCRISRLSRNEKSLQRNASKIAFYQDQNCWLQEGIDGLRKMGNDEVYTFWFDTHSNGTTLYSYKTSYESTDIFIMCDEYLSTAWHESVHVQDWMNNSFIDPEGEMAHDFIYDKNNGLYVLCSINGVNGKQASVERYNDFRQSIEVHAYTSEYAFSLTRATSRFTIQYPYINSFEAVERNIHKLLQSAD